MTTFPTYSTGTVSVGANATTVVGSGTIWSGVNARPGDDIVIAGHTVVVLDVTDTTHLVIDAWPYTAVAAGASYKIIQRSPLRFAGGLAMADVQSLIAVLNGMGTIYAVIGAAPDPSIGSDGQYALKTNVVPWQLWLKVSGVWQLQGSPGGAIRQLLTANITYYVRTDGNDSNTGLANTAGGAFLTIQKAVNFILQTLDCAGFIPTIQVADGTYTGRVNFYAPAINCHEYGIFLQGNATTPGNCVISTTSADAILIQNGAHVRAGGFKLQTTTSGNGINCQFGGIFENAFVGTLDFGACADSHWNAGVDGTIFSIVNYTISGGATSHWHTGGEGASITNGVQTITLTGTPAFSAYFCGTNKGSVACGGVTFAGSATGTRFVCHVNGTIDAGSQTRTFLPGNAAGILDNGGVYSGSESDKYDPQSAWKTYNPGAPTSQTGAFTTVTAAGKYKLDGAVCHFQLKITYTNIGTASGAIFSFLPITSVNDIPIYGVNPDNGEAVRGYAQATNTQIVLLATTFPINTAHHFISGTYEVSPTA